MKILGQRLIRNQRNKSCSIYESEKTEKTEKTGSLDLS
jgi:hypothetical protein